MSGHDFTQARQHGEHSMREVRIEADPEAILKRLTQKHGPPAYTDSKGNLKQINERFFAELIAYEVPIVHEAEEEKFYLYNSLNGRWQRTSTHLLKDKLSNRIRQADREWQRGLSQLDTEANRRAIVSLLRGVVERTEFFVDRPYAIHAANCMLAFENGSVLRKSFAPEFRSRNQLSVTFEPEALCPRFEKELLTPALNSDDLRLTKKMFGLLVLGRNRPQRIFILIGGANTGKTTTGLVAEGLIGPQNCAELRTSQLEGRFEMARLVNKTLLFGPDVAANFLMSVGAHRLKSLVGRDALVAERKNSNDDFRFKGDINALITANEDLLVRLRGGFDKSAWARRLCIIHFARQPVLKRIANFDEVLLAEEGSGILNLAISGLADYYRDEAIRGDIILPAEQTRRIDNLLSQSDGIRTFIIEELVETDGSELSSDELVVGYASYAKAKGWKVPRRNVIESQIQDLMLESWGITQAHSIQRDGKNCRGYRGLRIRQGDEPDPL